ncbi:MAG: GTPase, partial [Crinalium sp.]
MVRLKFWQWIVLALPVASIIGFLLVAAGLQIHEWRINWIWGIFTVIFLGWRWLLVKWTQPMVDQMESVIAQVSKDLASASGDAKLQAEGNDIASKAEVALQEILTTAQSDRPIWEDWQTFWQRCQELVAAIAQIYNPELKYPLLNIY